MESKVTTPHSFTGRMCAASRWKEHNRKKKDSLFQDPLAYKLAGEEGRAAPMGDWVMVPRTRYVDDFITDNVKKLIMKQQNDLVNVVLLGAGMDSRAFRLENIEQTIFFEIDQATTFDVKEPLVKEEQLKSQKRFVISTDFQKDNLDWKNQLQNHDKFDSSLPTIWIMEGLLMYLKNTDTEVLLESISSLSAVNSMLFADVVSRAYVSNPMTAPNVMGAQFIGGRDDYAEALTRFGFDKDIKVLDMDHIKVNRKTKSLDINERKAMCNEKGITKSFVKGDRMYFFVQATKT